MATFIPGAPTLGNMSSENLAAIELRVISDLMSEQRATSANVQTLAQLRNDAASDLGLVPPVIPPGN
jgi:hypothetical protein